MTLCDTTTSRPALMKIAPPGLPVLQPACTLFVIVFESISAADCPLAETAMPLQPALSVNTLPMIDGEAPAASTPTPWNAPEASVDFTVKPSKTESRPSELWKRTAD